MVDIREVLKQLNSKGIAFAVVDGKLRSKSPDGALTPEIIAIIKQRKDDIIAFMADERVAEQQQLTRVIVTKDQRYPASSAQKRLWITEHLQGAGGVYHIPLHLRYNQHFNSSAFKQAINEIIVRHEALRTTFIQDGSALIQCVNDPRTVPVVELNCVTDTEQAVKAIIRRESARPFDLQSDLMLRCVIIQRADNQTDVLICINHVAADGWSVDILLQELATFYADYHQLASGQTKPPAERILPFQYKDFSAWQADYLQSDAFMPIADFWQQQLAGIPLHHSLPLDFERPEKVSNAGKNLTVKLDSSLATQVHGLKKAHNITTFMAMQALFALLLGRWSHEKDIVIGTPVAGRSPSDTNAIIGFFVNTLVLRHQLDDAESLAEFLQKSKAMVLASMAHQVMPFEQLVDTFNPGRSNQFHPIFQIAFSYNTGKKQLLSGAGATLAFVDLGIAKYDLHLQVTEEDDGEIWLNWEYSTDIFDPATIASLSSSYQMLLQSAATSPHAKVASLAIVRAADPFAAVLNNQPVVYQAIALLHQSFAKMVQRYPDNIALVFGDASCTYTQLDDHAHQLYTFLRELGVTDGQLVGLYTERSMEMIIGILAILKAGAAYLPLDPDNPTDRTAFIVDDANVGVVLTQSHLVARLGGITAKAVVDIQTLTVNEGHCAGSICDSAPLDAPGGPLAYVIYTSGSTGQPKGVPIEHQNVQRLFQSAAKCFTFSEADKWTLFHSFAFDFSVWEIWGALLHGGTLVIVPYGVSRDPKQFSQLLVQQQVTVLNQTPSSFYPLSEQLIAKPQASALRCVIFGGEALEPFRLKKWYNRFNDAVQLVNMYGITETTVHVTWFNLCSKDVSRARSPIGIPLDDLTCLICNDALQLQPMGAVGELLVGGAGLAPYYLNRPALTEARFVYLADGQRFYRSGDLVRMGYDGTMTYFGRRDQQVKLRGFRIELGEIERTIEQLASVEKSLVRLWQDNRGDSHLIAYLQTSPTFTDDSLPELKEYIAARLPAYMAIHRFILLAAMPLTHNGKIDLRRLPEPQASALVHEKYLAPQTEQQQQLCDIWKRVLQCGRVGLTDNFFALGGDSIRVLQLVSEMRKGGFDYEVADVFAHQSVQQLSHHRGSVNNTSNRAVPLHLLGQSAAMLQGKPQFEDGYPLTSLQQTMRDKHLAYGASVYAPQHILQFNTDHFEAERLKEILVALVKKYPVLRTRIGRNHSGEAVQYIVAVNQIEADTPCFVIPDENPLATIEATHGDLLGQSFSFDEASPLYRFAIFTGATRNGYLLIRCHHAIEDGWGFVNVLNDLQQAYFSGIQIDATPLENVFKQHVALEIEAANDPQCTLAWQELLTDYKPMNGLFSKSADTDWHYGQYRCSMNASQLAEIKQKSAALKVSIRTVFLYEWYCTLANFAGQDSVTIDVVTNARSARLSDPTGGVGLFWNLLPINLLLTDQPDADIKHLHQRLLKSEQYGLYPASAIKQAGLIAEEDFAGFNFVNFHHYDDSAATDAPQTMQVLSATDHFHHELKCTVSVSPNQQSVDLWFEYNSDGVFNAHIDMIARRYCAALPGGQGEKND